VGKLSIIEEYYTYFPYDDFSDCEEAYDDDDDSYYRDMEVFAGYVARNDPYMTKEDRLDTFMYAHDAAAYLRTPQERRKLELEENVIAAEECLAASRGLTSDVIMLIAELALRTK